MNGPPVFLKPDRDQVRRLAEINGLPTGDLEAVDLVHFLGLGSTADPEGVVGLELFGKVGLLRSLAVAPDRQGAGKGRALVAAAEAHARRHGVERLYLLTTTAERFFSRLGYFRTPRESAPTALQTTREFAALCPSSAVCMVKMLETNP